MCVCVCVCVWWWWCTRCDPHYYPSLSLPPILTLLCAFPSAITSILVITICCGVPPHVRVCACARVPWAVPRTSQWSGTHRRDGKHIMA